MEQLKSKKTYVMFAPLIPDDAVRLEKTLAELGLKIEVIPCDSKHVQVYDVLSEKTVGIRDEHERHSV